MQRLTTQALKAALSTIHFSGAAHYLAPMTRGQGVIFMLHHVAPGAALDFEPNRILKVTPEFLEGVIRLVRELGYDTIGMDEVPERLRSPQRRPFVCFTLDDGYRDNIQYAYPVFKRFRVPFTIYLPAAFADGTGNLWWLKLQEAIRNIRSLSFCDKDDDLRFVTQTTDEKYAAYDYLYRRLRLMSEQDARNFVRNLVKQSAYDATGLCRNLVMSWSEARTLARDPLVTFGAHTCNHFALAKLPHQTAYREISDSIARLEFELGIVCRHFSYPYGDATSAGKREFEMSRSVGLATAVTTQKGLIHAHHRHMLTALPRLSLNGDFQKLTYIKALLSGIPFALWNAVDRVQSVVTHRRGEGKMAQHAPGPNPPVDESLWHTSK